MEEGRTRNGSKAVESVVEEADHLDGDGPNMPRLIEGRRPRQWARRFSCGGGCIDMKRTKSFMKLVIHGPLRESAKVHEHEGSKEWTRHESIEGASSTNTHQRAICVIPGG
mgnify:CR=1 FL=1